MKGISQSQSLGQRTFRNCDVLEQKDDCGDWQLRSKGSYKRPVDVRGTNVLESTRNRSKNFDRRFT